MNKYYIPTIEEIYNIYHRETMHAMKGIYPKSIKNFENILNKKNIELLIRFQNVIKRSYDSIDWKLYIKACAEYFKYRFDIKILCLSSAVNIGCLGITSIKDRYFRKFVVA